MEVEINNKYRLSTKIGRGAFGEVFVAIDIDTNEEVAVKLEDSKSKHPQLNYEFKVMKLLSETVGIPKTYWFGESNDK